MSFKVSTVFPGIHHICDSMGVCMTLIVGQTKSLLIDAGYGLEPIGPVIQGLTSLPCRLVLSHGHHDHALGAMQFEQVWLHPAERTVYETYTDHQERNRVLAQASAQGVSVKTADYLSRPMPKPELIRRFIKNRTSSVRTRIR